MLTSTSSNSFAYFNQLKKKKKRSASGKFLIEGIHLVQEAGKKGLLDRVIFTENLKKSREGIELLKNIIGSGIKCEEATSGVIAELSEVEAPQGIIASVTPQRWDLGDILTNDHPLLIIACGIQDPGNLGTMIRTADAAACDGFIITSGTVDPYNDKVIRSTAGSIFHLKVVKVDDIIELVSSLKRRGVTIVSTIVGSEKLYFDVDYKRPVAILIGNEGSGLSKEIERLSDESVSIPILGSAESLNAAVSSSVILYEAVRQRRINAGNIN